MFEIEFFHEESQIGLIVEDNGKVAYAYMCDAAGKGLGMVWLWNHGVPPDDFEGVRGEPVRNPKHYLIGWGDPVPESGDDIKVSFRMKDGVPDCAIYVRDRLLASVSQGSFPGRNVNVAVENNLAKPWPQKNRAVLAGRFEIEGWLRMLSDPHSSLYGPNAHQGLVIDVANDLDDALSHAGPLTFHEGELTLGRELNNLLAGSKLPERAVGIAEQLLSLMIINDWNQGIEHLDPRPRFPVRLDGYENEFTEGQVNRGGESMLGETGTDSITRPVIVVRSGDGFDAQLVNNT